MKLIQEIKYNSNIEHISHISYIYENNITKTLFKNGTIFWTMSGSVHRTNGPAIENCFNCIKYLCSNYKNKRLRHFYLHEIIQTSDKFAYLTNHKICKWCNDFCKQECFIE